MSRNVNPPLPSRSRAFAGDLRRKPTDAESRLWFQLRGKRLDGRKFRRQHPIPPYVVDFYCGEIKLAIELDGSHHSDSADASRTKYLAALGMQVLRFWDNQVLNDMDGVLAAIVASIQARTLTPTPLPMGEGLKTSVEK